MKSMLVLDYKYILMGISTYSATSTENLYLYKTVIRHLQDFCT